MATTVEGTDARDVMRQIHAGQKLERGITIEPIQSAKSVASDRGYWQMPEGHKAMPTEHFRVRWNNDHESFVREVSSMKELYDVLRPIFQAHRASKRAFDRQEALHDKKVLEGRRLEIQNKIDGLKGHIKSTQESIARMEKERDALG